MQTHTLAAIVRKPPQVLLDDPSAADPFLPDASGHAFLEVRSRLNVGDRIELLYPEGITEACLVTRMELLTGERLQTAHPNTWIRIPISFPTIPGQVVRMVRSPEKVRTPGTRRC
ncbi:MAG: U32 family peptidase C-terminal domain-containing protein [Syntrophobacteraceae bacterium]